MTVKCGDSFINSRKAIKYLGIIMDQKMIFIEHATTLHKEVSMTIRSHIAESGWSQGKQVTSPCQRCHVTAALRSCWEPSMAQSGWAKLETLHRRIALRKVCAYRSVSYAAVAVIARMPPVRLAAKERTNLYAGMEKETARRCMMEEWQESWRTEEKGRWTYTLIPVISAWVNRRHGEVDYQRLQFLTGHGSFDNYLQRSRRRNTDHCQLCDVSPDSAEHAVLECYEWHTLRREAEVYLGQTLTKENIVLLMLESRENWRRITELVGKIMSIREEVEREVFRTLNSQG